MTEGRPLIEILGEIVDDNPDLEAVSLLDLTLMKEAQASRSLDGETQSLPPEGDGEPFEGYPPDAEPEKAIYTDQVSAGQWTPPSTTVIRTKNDGWYYVTDPFEAVIDAIVEGEDGGFMLFDVVGNEATQVAIRASEITAITDLTPRD